MTKIKDIKNWSEVGPKKKEIPFPVYGCEGAERQGRTEGFNTCLESVEELSVELDREELIKILDAQPGVFAGRSEKVADAIIANQSKILRVEK